VLGQRNPDDLGPERAQDQQRPVVGRRFDQNTRAVFRQQLSQENEALERAVRDDDPARRHAVPLGDPGPQRRVAAGRPVGEHRGAVLLDRRPCAVGQLLDRDALGGRHAARERDRLHETGL
jgi:hypothetical protein